MKRLLRYIALSLSICSCLQPAFNSEDQATVYFVFGKESVKTLNVDDEYISNCNIMVYDANGALVAGRYNADGLVPSVSFNAVEHGAYRFYCVCNIGDITDVELFKTESGLANYQYSVADYSEIIDENGAVPMTGSSGYIIVSDGMNVYIDLIRCVALVTVRIDDAGLDCSTIRVHSIVIKNVPKKVGLFQTSSPASTSEREISGDSASLGELSTFNTGGTVGFYLFENCQGELLPGNTTCEGKVLSDESPYRDLCSYLELSGTYDDQMSQNPRYGNFIYRFYLGGNTTSDFSLVRNHHYDITILLNDDGVDEVSWRVDDDLTPYATSVVVTPPQYTFNGTGGTCNLTATILPSSAAQEVTWSSSNTSVATVSQSGKVTAVGLGNAVISATATDGSGISGSSAITVRDPSIIPVSIEPNYLERDSWKLVRGSSIDDFEVTVNYSDGGSRTLTGAEALATVDTHYSDFTVTSPELTAADYEIDYTLDPAVLCLKYTEGGTLVTFVSYGGIFDSDDICQISVNPRAIAGGTVATVTKATALAGIPISSWDVSVKCTNSYLYTSGSRIYASAANPWNGPLSYVVTATFLDDFFNKVTKTRNANTTVYQWRERWYRVEIDTNVRDHIDAGYGSQEQPDNIRVRCILECPDYGNTTVCEYYFPASYDQNGDLSMSYFTYTWYDTTLTLQMQDLRSYYFNYDRNGNYLTEGYCIEGGTYIYYEPF